MNHTQYRFALSMRDRFTAAFQRSLTGFAGIRVHLTIPSSGTGIPAPFAEVKGAEWEILTAPGLVCKPECSLGKRDFDTFSLEGGFYPGKKSRP